MKNVKVERLTLRSSGESRGVALRLNAEQARVLRRALERHVLPCVRAEGCAMDSMDLGREVILAEIEFFDSLLGRLRGSPQSTSDELS